MSNKNKQKQDYEALGKIVASVYENGYLDAGKSYRMSFIKGMIQGLGATIGATVLVAILLWLLTLFGEVPLVGRFTDTVKDTVESQQ